MAGVCFLKSHIFALVAELSAKDRFGLLELFPFDAVPALQKLLTK